MGPITLFDKSFIQSLSLDESVWFDHLFLTNVCPIFYVETLADLNKNGLRNRSPEEEVQIIAKKFPEMNSIPCALHYDLCLDSLIGFDVPMIGQIPSASGRLVQYEGEPNVISDESPVAQAFSRWQKGEYLDVERQFAHAWREKLQELDLGEMSKKLDYLNINTKTCRTLEEARDLAVRFISSSSSPFFKMEIALTFLQIPQRYEARIRSRWVELGYPSIRDFAPYAAFMLSVEIFFLISLKVGLISSQRVSNLTDIAYFFYLPFSMIFVSSDRLHKKVTPLFLRDGQEFVWGSDLKSSLKEINLFFSLFPDSKKEEGIHALAPTPPKHINTLVSDLWDRHLLPWRKRESSSVEKTDVVKFVDIKAKVDKISKAITYNPDPSLFKVADIQSATIKRKVHKKKGAWYQIPKKFD